MKHPKSYNYNKFEEAVTTSFLFLEKDYGFILAKIEQIGYSKIIRYESRLVYVNLFYGPPSYEPELSFGRVGIDDLPTAYSFGPGDLVLSDYCVNWKWKADYPNHLTGLVAEFARLLQECGMAFIKGDQTSFIKMKNRRDTAVEVWHQEELVKKLKKEIDIAWHQKNYSKVVSQYTQIIKFLTKTDKKKLEYAKKQVEKAK